jgi:hypothetical protein
MESHSKPSMTAERFVEYIQNCYNDRFHDDMKKTMLGYLRPFDECFIACLARITIMRHPRQYRTAPGIAELEKYSDEAYQQFMDLQQDLSIPAIEEQGELSEDERAQIEESLANLSSRFVHGLRKPLPE